MNSVAKILFGLCILGSAFVGCKRDGGPIVAQVGPSKITLADLESRLRETPQAYQQYAGTAEGRKQFLNLMIREKVLAVEARKAGLNHEDAYLKAVRHFKDEWKQRLGDYEESLLVDSYLRKMRSSELAISDADVERFYNDHRSDYEHPVSLQVAHILLSTQADAQAALDRLKDGDAFADVAHEMSKDPATAAAGGRLKPFQRGALVPEFEDAAFALKNGQVSGIVKTPFGFHIIKRLGQTDLPPLRLGEAKEHIRARLERDKFNQWVAARQTSLGVTVNDQVMAQVSVPPPTQP